MPAGTTIFGSVLPGTAKVISLGAAVPASIQMAVTPNPFEGAGVVVTSVGYNGRNGAQLMQSLGRSIYLYSFGLRAGVVSFDGVAFSRVCGDSGTATGMSSIIPFFENSAINGTLVDIQLGSSRYVGLVDTLLNTWSDTSFGALGFRLQLHAVRSDGSAVIASP